MAPRAADVLKEDRRQLSVLVHSRLSAAQDVILKKRRKDSALLLRSCDSSICQAERRSNDHAPNAADEPTGKLPDRDPAAARATAEAKPLPIEVS